MSDQAVLLTGAAGFIGFHATRQLLADGCTIIGLDNLNDYYDAVLKCQAHRARFPISTRTHREVLAPMDRAEEKAGPKDVGEQALMRGLDTAFPFFRLGLSLV